MEPSAQERAFAAEVERYRAAARVTQDWVAGRVGLSRPKVSEICGGSFLPSRQVLDALVTALAMDRERAVELWNASWAGREERRAAEKAAGHPRPEGWTALPVLPAEVRSLLRAQVQAAQELPYRLRGARRPPLGAVYVRQDLGGGVEETLPDRPRQEPVLDARGLLRLPPPPTRLRVRPPARTVRAALDGDDHLLVTGGPGQGKSTLSLRLAADIAVAWDAHPTDRAAALAGAGVVPRTGTRDAPRTEDGQAPLAEPVVPLRLTARELATRLDLPFPQALAGSVGSEYGMWLSQDVPQRLLAGRVAGCRWLLLIDGLDEVAVAAHRDRLVSVLSAWACDPDAPYRLILTTRPVGGATLAPLQRAAAARYELQPFDEAALRQFAVNWFAPEGAETADRFVWQVREAHLDELVQVPLLATIAAIVFEQHGFGALPDNRYELFEEYLEYLRSEHTVPAGPFDRLLTPLLEHLGEVRLETDTSLVAAARQWVAERLAAGDRPAGWQEELTRFLAAVGPLHVRGDDLRFLHHSFAEHLAATAKARRLPGTFDPAHPAFADHLHAAQQGERGRHARSVLLHYTRLHLSEADRVVRWLHDGGSDRQLLAARLLAWHLPASAEVVDAFLATARDWAMTTKGTGLEILRRVSRAAYHAGLAPWLAGLMADGIAPWPSRVEAASAMAARLRGTSETAEATAMLRQLVADQAVPVADRVAAAEGLAQCDGADRDAADQALRVLLAEPEVPAERRRSAAVVLAGLGPESHAHAVRALSRLLDDPDTPVEDLVQAATGLTEISADTHERSAEVFRGVLGGRAHTIAGRREAALGLAALGPHHLADSVTALTALVTDPGLDRGDRLSAVQALAEMGPDYVDVAADHVMYMLAEPGLDRFERRQCAERLGRLGAGYHSAAAGHLRAIAADRAAGTNVTMWALRALADIGPDYHAEAAQGLWQLSADSLAGGYDRICALGTLAKMDTHHRGRATDRLRAALSDRHADPSDRVTAAGELVDQGTQFHPEVVGALLDVIATQSDPVVVSDAAWRLAGLGTRFHQPAVAAMLRALTSPDAIGYARYNLALDLAQHAEPGTEYRKQAAEAFCDVLADASRSDRSRAVAAAGLVRLGRPYHRTAMDGLRELLRPGCDASFLGEPTVLDAVLSVRLGMRAEIAGAVRALLADPGTDADQTWAAAQALIRFGTVDAPEVVVALQAILTDEAADASAQRGAAVALARLEPARVAEAVAALRRLAASPPSPYVWEEAVFDLARLGEDAAPLAQAQLATPDADRALRETAASVLATLCPQLIGEALVELRVQAGDEHLHFRDRTDVITRLAELDESTLDAAISSHRAVLDDEGEPITIRSVAAYQLSQFDRAHWQHAVETLRRLLADPLTRPDDQQEAFENLLSLNALTPAESAQLSLAVLRHPSATPDVRRAIIGWLPHALRMEARRALLADHNAPITARIPDADTYGDRQLAAEAETAVREALAAVESTAPGRVEAAAALADLAHRLVLDAAHELEKLAREPSRAETRAQALTALARLGGAWRRTTIDTLRRAGTDVSRPRRERHRLVAVLTEIDSAPTPQVLGFLRDLAIDGRTSEVRRIDALHALRHADGLDPLRAIRDDPHAAPAARWRAAARLVEYSVEDRAASARVLDTVATDTTARAALRWRAAKDLARLGSAGRQRATRALESIAADGTLPVTARAEAARLLAEIRPDRRGHALNTLRDLLNTDNPHHRLTVLRAIGSIDTTEATPTLRTMARDRLLGPVVRLRCAEALTNLRRDQHEAAAIVARELMNDDGVPRHVRVRAARDLARWSELCREEARSQLRALLGTSPGTSPGQRDTTPPVP